MEEEKAEKSSEIGNWFAVGADSVEERQKLAETGVQLFV